MPPLNGGGGADGLCGSCALDVPAGAHLGLASAAAAVGRWQANPGCQKVIGKGLEALSLSLVLGAGKDGGKARGDVVVVDEGQRHKLVEHLAVCQGAVFIQPSADAGDAHSSPGAGWPGESERSSLVG